MYYVNCPIALVETKGTGKGMCVWGVGCNGLPHLSPLIDRNELDFIFLGFFSIFMK